MQDFTTGYDVNLNLVFKGSSPDPSIPTSGSATYTVCDHSGAPITGLIAIPITTGPATWNVTITIPASYNEIDPAKVFERRSVILNFVSNGVAYAPVTSYRIVPAKTFSSSQQDVRNFIGCNDDELPDDQIDLFVAYMLAANDFDRTVLDTALSSGTLIEVYANDAIVMQAVIQNIPSLQARVAQSEKNGIMAFARPTIKDFSGILQAALDRYNAALGIILDLVSTQVDVTLVVVTQDTDPVTGA